MTGTKAMGLVGAHRTTIDRSTLDGNRPARSAPRRLAGRGIAGLSSDRCC
jgi:hypothetical protein